MGSTRDWFEALVVGLIMTLLLCLWQGLVVGSVPSVWEFGGTLLITICIWLARTENVLTWPIGIAGTLAIGWFFWTIALPGQTALNWFYFVPVSFWAWYWWLRGDSGEAIAVTTLTWPGRLAVLICCAALWLFSLWTIRWLVPGSVWPEADALVVAASVVAQVLLGMKKVESWWLWLGPVNAVSVALYWTAGGHTVALLYVVFLVHAAFAIVRWHREAAR